MTAYTKNATSLVYPYLNRKKMLGVSSKGRGYSRIYKKKSKRFVTYLTHTVSENHPDLVGKRGGSRECVCPQHLCVKQPNGRIYTVRSSLPLTDRPWEPNVAPGHIFAY